MTAVALSTQAPPPRERSESRGPIGERHTFKAQLQRMRGEGSTPPKTHLAQPKAEAPADDAASDQAIGGPVIAIAPPVVPDLVETPALEPKLAKAIADITIDFVPDPIQVQQTLAQPPLGDVARPNRCTLTPLEAAVYEAVDQQLRSSDKDEPRAGAKSADAPLPIATTAPVDADAPAAAPEAPKALHAPEAPKLPEPPSNPSHVHLVLDDAGGDRLVVTVAVRGSQVNVALRGHDDATAAALARNAGSLDHAMRARGLDLASFASTRDEPRSQQHHHPERDAREREDYDEFQLEETT